MSIEDIEQDAQGQGDSEGGEESYDSGEVDSSFVVGETKRPISKMTVIMFVIILCAKAGMYYMYKRTTASKADAADAQSKQVIKQFMSDKDKNFSMMQKMLKDTESVVNQFMTYPSLKQIPLSDLQNNPFKMKSSKQEENDDVKAAARAAKEEAERLAAEKSAFEKAANGLRLQSIVTSGARKACMINNALYVVGQVIEVDGVTLTIEDIAPNRVEIKSGKHGAVLSMKK
jgi:hypothetical protein